MDLALMRQLLHPVTAMTDISLHVSNECCMYCLAQALCAMPCTSCHRSNKGPKYKYRDTMLINFIFEFLDAVPLAV